MNRRELLKASLVLPLVGVLKAEPSASTIVGSATIPPSLFHKTDWGIAIGPYDAQLEAASLLPVGVDYVYYPPTKGMDRHRNFTPDWFLIQESYAEYLPASYDWMGRYGPWIFSHQTVLPTQTPQEALYCYHNERLVAFTSPCDKINLGPGGMNPCTFTARELTPDEVKQHDQKPSKTI